MFGYQGKNHFAQLVKAIRVRSYNGKYHLQAKLPWYRGYFKVWYNIEQDGEVGKYPTSSTDKFSNLKDAQAFAEKLSKEIAENKIKCDEQDRKRRKDGQILGTYKVRTLKEDPEHFV